MQWGNMAEISISFETLFEFLRKEKSRDEIQELPHNYFEQIIKYLDEKRQEIAKRSQDGFFNSSLASQAENAARIIREIYDRREKKIIMLAVNKARTDSNIIDTSNLLPEEKKMFDSLVCELHNFRQGILDKVMRGETPDFIVCTPMEKEDEPELPADRKRITFMQDLDRFVGKELEEYGPFKTGENAVLPNDIAELLIRKGHAQ
jgi:DNA replication initiation complex subunit (GINS family)